MSAAKEEVQRLRDKVTLPNLAWPCRGVQGVQAWGWMGGPLSGLRSKGVVRSWASEPAKPDDILILCTVHCADVRTC